MCWRVIGGEPIATWQRMYTAVSSGHVAKSSTSSWPESQLGTALRRLLGSNDLTQLTLGVDRDSAEPTELFVTSAYQDEAVKWMIRGAI